jgi:hypothetical protein
VTPEEMRAMVLASDPRSPEDWAKHRAESYALYRQKIELEEAQKAAIKAACKESRKIEKAAKRQMLEVQRAVDKAARRSERSVVREARRNARIERKRQADHDRRVRPILLNRMVSPEVAEAITAEAKKRAAPWEGFGRRD